MKSKIRTPRRKEFSFDLNGMRYFLQTTRRLKLSHNAVTKIEQNYQKSGNASNVQKRLSRPCKLTPFLYVLWGDWLMKIR